MLSDTEQRFIQAFVQRHRRERARFELTSPERRSAFLGKLCHRHADILDPRFIAPLAREMEDPRRIYEHLRRQGAPPVVAVISLHNEFDGRELPLGEAVEGIFFYPFPSVLICRPNALCYFQAEHEAGVTWRFVLQR